MRTPPDEIDIVFAKIAAGDRPADHEGPTLDFKEDKSSLGDTERMIADAAICFANSAGGKIVVGVSDKLRGEAAIVGTRLEPERLAQRIFELSTPRLNVSVQRHSRHANVLVVTVPQSTSIHSDPQGRAYQRINRDCHPMTPDQQARLWEERQGIDWSAQPSGNPVEAVSAEALITARQILARFHDASRRQLAALSDRDLLTALGAICPNGTLNRAGDLMFCLPTTHSAPEIIYQYRATPGGEPKLVQRLGPPLLISITKTIEVAGARQSLTPVTLPSGQQISIEDFPSLAIREALSNALCHRDYHLTGSVVVEHSPEVFIITSPGPLVSGVTPDNIITTTPRPRNPALSRIVRVLGLAEELGRGVDRMYREMIRSGRDVPRIDAEYDRVKVTLVGGAPNTQIARFIATMPDEEREDTDTMLVLYKLCSAKTITAVGCASLLQKSPQEAEAVLRRLAGSTVGLLEPTRATVGRTGPTYRLREDALKSLGSAVVYQRRTTDAIDRKVVAHVREYGKITNRTLQNFFDVHVFKARDIIADLVQRGILVRISEQQRGPKVEWGPGPKFPKSKKRRSDASEKDGHQPE